MINLRELDSIEIGTLTFHKTKDQFIATGFYDREKTITIAHPRFMMSLGAGPVEFKVNTLADSERWTIVDQTNVGFPVYDPSDESVEPRFINNHQEAKENEVAMPLWRIKETLASVPTFNHANVNFLLSPEMEKLYVSSKMVEAVLKVIAKANP